MFKSPGTHGERQPGRPFRHGRGTSVMAITWILTRTGDTVRIHLTKAAGFTHDDSEAIAVTLEAYLTDEAVGSIKLDGPLLMNEGPRDGLVQAIRYIGNLARSRGKRFDVGQI